MTAAYTPPTTTQPRDQRPSPHQTRPGDHGTLPATTGHRATTSGSTPPSRGPLPPAPTRRQATPADLLHDLATQLREHGLHHLYATASPTEGVLSVAYGITVWTNGHTLRCHTPTHTIYLPASTHTAARHLASLTHHRPPGSPHPPRHPGTSPAGGDTT